MLIQGIHHVCIKCRKDEIEKVKHFYGELRMACHRAVSDILPSKQTMWINV